jgi:hypothetical protein
MTGTNSKIHNPDQFLAQDAENQFKTIFFQDGIYSGGGIVIRFIAVVGRIRKTDDIYSFQIFLSDDPENPVEMEYDDQSSALDDRLMLLMQIEQYHSRGI